jgi:uncharacterized phage protein (TIGR02218 family)
MRTLPEGLQAHLDRGATTLCWCWKLAGAQGLSLGFTDHDESLEFDGLVFEASSGFSSSEIQSSLGLNVDNLEASGALSSNRLKEEDFRAGRFDDALVEIWLVNWMNTSERLLLRKGNLGEITRGASSFTAEVRGLSHHLNQPQGRIYQYGCDAALGDARCRVDLSSPLYRAEAQVVIAESSQRFAASGLGEFAQGWFARGRLEWTSGANVARAMEVRSHLSEGTRTIIELWQQMAAKVEEGDRFAASPMSSSSACRCRGSAIAFRSSPSRSFGRQVSSSAGSRPSP